MGDESLSAKSVDFFPITGHVTAYVKSCVGKCEKRNIFVLHICICILVIPPLHKSGQTFSQQWNPRQGADECLIWRCWRPSIQYLMSMGSSCSQLGLSEWLLLNFTAAPNKSSFCLQPGAFSMDVSRAAGSLTRSLWPSVCRAGEEKVSSSYTTVRQFLR